MTQREGGKIQVLESGMKLYQMVDGKLVEVDAETAKRHLEWLEGLSPEERKRLDDVTPRMKWVVVADCSEAN